MTFHQKMFAIIATLLLFSFIIYLIKNKRLKEEYSVLWFSTGLILIIIVIWYTPLVYLTNLIGAVLPTTTLFIFSIIFLMAISLHFALKISYLTDQVKDLAQEISIIKSQHVEDSSKFLGGPLDRKE